MDNMDEKGESIELGDSGDIGDRILLELIEIMKQVKTELEFLRPDSELCKKIDNVTSSLQSMDVARLIQVLIPADVGLGMDQDNVQELIEMVSTYEKEAKNIKNENIQLKDSIEEYISLLKMTEDRISETYESKLNQISSDYAALAALHHKKTQEIEQLSDNILHLELKCEDKADQLMHLEYDLATLRLSLITS